MIISRKDDPASAESAYASVSGKKFNRNVEGITNEMFAPVDAW
jgi:hypothetical protein